MKEAVHIKANQDYGLLSIDWRFTERTQKHPLEDIHPYPAKFISEIPDTLLSLLPVQADTIVFDPFCGSGTTLSVAQKLGFASVGIDVNPIACLISRVKTAQLPTISEDDIMNLVTMAKANNRPHIRDIPNITHWFKKDIILAVASLVQEINSLNSLLKQDIYKLALSSILVRVSNQESDTRYAAIPKVIMKGDVFRLFSLSCLKILNALKLRNWKLEGSNVITMDTLEADSHIIDQPVGIVITSPPYPNAYEYWLYHKYRMWWLGFDPIDVKAKEIGARAHFFKKSSHDETNFSCQMRQTFCLICDVLVKSGFACFVIGRSVIHGRTIDNSQILESTSKEFGMKLVARADRLINSKRKSFNLSHANIKTETVMVFQKK